MERCVADAAKLAKGHVHAAADTVISVKMAQRNNPRWRWSRSIPLPGRRGEKPWKMQNDGARLDVLDTKMSAAGFFRQLPCVSGVSPQQSERLQSLISIYDDGKWLFSCVAFGRTGSQEANRSGEFGGSTRTCWLQRTCSTFERHESGTSDASWKKLVESRITRLSNSPAIVVAAAASSLRCWNIVFLAPAPGCSSAQNPHMQGGGPGAPRISPYVHEWCQVIICEQYTHKYSTYKVAQHDHISPREHAWVKSWKAQDCTSLCPKISVIHVSCLIYLPHLTLTTSTSSLSPTSSIFPTISPKRTQACRYTILVYPAMFHGRVADQHKSHLSQVMSPTSARPKQPSLKTSILEELSLTVILGRIRIKYRKDKWEAISKNLSPKVWVNLEKLVPRCPTSSHRCTPIMTQRRALQTRILKNGELREMLASLLYLQSREDWIMQQLDIKIVSGTESTGTPHKENKDQFLKPQGRGLFSQEKTNNIEAQFQCRHLQEGLRLWVRSYWWNYRRILWLDSKDSKFRSCNSTNSPVSIILCLENTIQKSSDFLLWFCIGSNVMEQRSGDGWFITGIEVLAILFWKEFSKFLRCWTRRLLLLWGSSRIPTSRRGSASRSRAQKEDRFLRGRQIAYMIYDYFRATGVLDYAGLFSITLRNDNIQEFDTRSDEMRLSMTEIPPDDVLESLYTLRIRESDQNCFRIVRHGASSEDIDAQLSEIEDNGQEEYRSETSIAKFLTPDTGKIKQEQWSRIEREQVALREEKEFAISGKQKASVRKETHAVSGMRVTIVLKNQNTKPPHLPSPSRDRSVSRKRSIRGKSNHGAIFRQPCRYYLEGTCTRSPCEYWHPPECQFYKTETGCKAGEKYVPASWGWWTTKRKAEKELSNRKSDDKGAVAIAKILPAGEARNDFWSIAGNFIYRHHVETKVKLYSPREESFPIPLKYTDVSRTTQTNLDVMQESRMDDYWNIEGSRDLSDSWTGFTKSTPLSEKPPEGYTWSCERLTKRQATSRPDHLWPELWRGMPKNAKLREKHKWAIEKPKLDNARQLRSIFFIEQDDMESKHTMRNVRRKLEIPMPAATPCETPVNCRGETCSSIEKRKT